MATDDQHPPDRRRAPTNAELAERMARVEEKQDGTIETLERIEGHVDGRLSGIEEKQDAEIEPKTRRMWLLYQGGKWLVGMGATGGAVSFAISSVPI